VHLTYDNHAKLFKTFCIEFSRKLDKHMEDNLVNVCSLGFDTNIEISQHHIPEDYNRRIHCNRNLKTENISVFMKQFLSVCR
jgi:hypothetical protein